MSEAIEGLLKRLICERTGLSAAELAEDAGLYSAGADGDDLEDAWIAACKTLGIDPRSIKPEEVADASGWLLTSLRHLGPFWPTADAGRRKVEAEARVPAEPTIRSLAASLRAGRMVPAGPDVPVPPAPPLSGTQVTARAASVGVLTLFAGPAFGFLTCTPLCHACHGSMNEAVTAGLPVTLPILAAICLAFILPGVLHVRLGTAATAISAS